MLIDQKTLDEVMAKHPALTANGFAEGEPVDLGQVDLAMRWLEYHGRRATINPKFSSYGLKHLAEKTTAALRPGAVPYISNGAFIAAAVHLGYRVSRIRNTPNVCLNFSYNDKNQKTLLGELNK